MSKRLLRSFMTFVWLAVLLSTLTINLSRTASAQVGKQSCAVYDGYLCCQWFVRTAYGWIPLTEPDWVYMI